MTTKAWHPAEVPIFGCLTGVELQSDQLDVLPGVTLSRIFADTFGATMMAFAPPPSPGSHHPAPWAAVRGGTSFESRVQLEISDLRNFDGLTPSVAAWLVAAVLRLRAQSPIRLAVLANLPIEAPNDDEAELVAIAFENAAIQIGCFSSNCTNIGQEEASWLHAMLPTAARLYHDERFFRAFSIYDQAQWAPTPEIGTVLVWTAIEILFDLGGEREKTKAICKALADFVAVDRSDRDRAYQSVQSLYYKRGQTVHAGRSMEAQDVAQSFNFASVAFQKVLIDGRLPLPRSVTIH